MTTRRSTNEQSARFVSGGAQCLLEVGRPDQRAGRPRGSRCHGGRPVDAASVILGGRRSSPAGACSRYLEAFDALAADPARLLPVVTDDGQVLATMQLSGLPRARWPRGARRIEAVRVRQDCRSRVLGAALLTWRWEARGRGCAWCSCPTAQPRSCAITVSASQAASGHEVARRQVGQPGALELGDGLLDDRVPAVVGLDLRQRHGPVVTNAW